MIRAGPSARRRGFTMVEAAISAIVLGLLAAATLNTVSAAAAGRKSSADRAMARMLTEDLMTEIRSLDYAEPSNPSAPLGPDALESIGASRLLFDDVDDFHGLTEAPPKRPDGTPMPGLTAWTRQTTVEWVNAANPVAAAASETSVKRVRIIVRRGNRVLARSESLRTGAWTKSVRTNKAINAITTEAFVTPK